jgi:hypothetical protein
VNFKCSIRQIILVLRIAAASAGVIVRMMNIALMKRENDEGPVFVFLVDAQTTNDVGTQT